MSQAYRWAMSVVAVIAQSWFASAGGGSGSDDVWAGGGAPREKSGRQNPVVASDDDRTSVSRIRAGDSAEFDALVRRVFPLLSRVAARLVGSGPDGEEVAQDVLCRVWIQRDALPDNVPLTVYLLSAVRKRALNVLRDRRTADRFRGELPAPAMFPATDADVIANERRAEVVQSLNALTPRHRLAVELRYGALASYHEIGAALGVSDRAAEQIVRRALLSLRRALGEIDL